MSTISLTNITFIIRNFESLNFIDLKNNILKTRTFEQMTTGNFLRKRHNFSGRSSARY